MKKIIGIYVGDDHPVLKGTFVKVVRNLEPGLLEVQPWVEKIGRYSFVTFDAREEDIRWEE